MRRWYVASVAAAAVVGVAVGVLAHNRFAGGSARALALPTLHGQATWPRGSKQAPGFALRDQHGRQVSLTSLRGRAVALMFMDSLCKEACPLEGRMLAAAVAGTPVRDRPHVVIVSVNPAGDTPRTVAAAGRRWRLPTGYEWLLGTRAQLAGVWKQYDITVDAVSGDVVHSTAVYLIDARGDERAGFLLPFVPGLVSDDLRSLGEGRA